MQKDTTLERAIYFATYLHKGQKDKVGLPYILHPLSVMLACQKYGEEAQIVAVLHDVVEDCDITIEEFEATSFPKHIIEAVYAISKRPGEDYETYLSRVRVNDLALKVKIEDIRHNMSRLLHLEPSDAGYLAKKYSKAMQFLTNNLNILK